MRFTSGRLAGTRAARHVLLAAGSAALAAGMVAGSASLATASATGPATGSGHGHGAGSGSGQPSSNTYKLFLLAILRRDHLAIHERQPAVPRDQAAPP